MLLIAVHMNIIDWCEIRIEKIELAFRHFVIFGLQYVKLGFPMGDAVGIGQHCAYLRLL